MFAYKRYFILALIFFTGIAAPINQFKLPPLMPQVIADMQIGLTDSGWLMSVFALAGVIFALPSGRLLNRFGPRKIGLLSIGLVLAGSIMCALSYTMPSMMAGRILEGAGTSLYSVAGPAAICLWFRPSERGIPMGIWSTWVPVGAVFMYTSAPLLNIYWDWRHIWMMASIYTAVFSILFLFFFKSPSTEPCTVNQTTNNNGDSTFKAKDVWLLAAIFACFNTITIAIKSYMPAFLEAERGFSELQASGSTGIFLLTAMVISPFAGILSDKIGSRKKLIIAGACLATVSVLLVFNVTGSMISVSLAMLGVAAGMLTTGIFTAVSEAGRSATGMAAVVFGQYAGMCIGPVYFGLLTETFNWWVAGYMQLPMIAAMFVMIFMLKVK